MSTTLLYSCPYIPGEWIVAHGLQPMRIMPETPGLKVSQGLPPGLCSYVQAFIRTISSNTSTDGVVLTTVCDQMRRASEVIAREYDLPVFLMNVPNTWKTATSMQIFLSELKRLGRFMTSLGGTSPSDKLLTEVMTTYNTVRSTLRNTREYVSARSFSESLVEFHRTWKTDCTQPVSTGTSPGLPLGILGGPLLHTDFHIFDLVEERGGTIVLDATETGERTLPAPFNTRQLCDDPLTELAVAYFGTIPDASRRPNSQLYSWLKHRIYERKIRGIIFRRHLWCDLWHAETGRLKEWASLPLIEIDSTGEPSSEQRTVNRIHSFMEMLE